MAQNGVWQLKNLTIRYSMRGGSSKGMRSLLEKHLDTFKEQNPQLEIRAYSKVGHPFIRGEYCKK
jgi:hypothetical protein